MSRQPPTSISFPSGIIPQGDFVRAAGLTGIRRLIARQGGDVASVMAQHHLQPAMLDQPDRFISYSAVIELLEDCADQFAMPHFGLDLAEMQTIDVLGPLAVMLSASETLGDALRIVGTYLHVHGPGASTRVEVGAKEATLTFRVNDPRYTFRRQINELSIALGMHLMLMMAGPGFRPIEVHIAGDTPFGAGRRAEQFFRAPVLYEQEATALVFPAELWTLRLATQNSNLLRIATSYLQSLRYAASDDLELIVNQLIVELLPLGECSLESMARHLCCHPRTLQNRLAALGLEFRQLVAEQRYRLAQAYLTTTSTPIVEVAARLGYADQAGFTRAFSAWAGESPKRFRRAHATRLRPA